MKFFVERNERITIIENKLSKNIGIMCKAKLFLTHLSLRSSYLPFVHRYLHYNNIPWRVASKRETKQKQWLEIVNDDCGTLETRAKLKIVNVCKFNLFQTLNLIFKFRNNLAALFRWKMKEISHLYLTGNSPCFRTAPIIIIYIFYHDGTLWK